MHSKITLVTSLPVILKLIMDSKQCGFVFKLEHMEYAFCPKHIVKPRFEDQARSSNQKPEDWENRSCALFQGALVLGNCG